MKKKAALQILMDDLRKGSSLTVEEGKTLFYEEDMYFRTIPGGRVEIPHREAVAELRAFIERTRREKGKGR